MARAPLEVSRPVLEHSVKRIPSFEEVPLPTQKEGVHEMPSSRAKLLLRLEEVLRYQPVEILTSSQVDLQGLMRTGSGVEVEA